MRGCEKGTLSICEQKQNRKPSLYIVNRCMDAVEMHELYANKQHKMQFGWPCCLASAYDSSNHSHSHMPTEFLRSKNNSSSYT